MKAYLINLDRSPGRLAEADAQLCAAGVDYVRVAAVDGRALGWAGLRGRVSRLRFFLVHGHFPSVGEAACTLSHNAALRRLAEGGEGAAMVFEDDVGVDGAALREALAAVEARLDPARAEIFLLCDHEGTARGAGRGLAPAGDAHFAEGYVATAAAARRLLALNAPVRAAIDAWGHWAGRGIRVWKACPPACAQRDVVSEITGGRRPKRRAGWGWYVALWRLRVGLGQALDGLLYRVCGR